MPQSEVHLKEDRARTTRQARLSQLKAERFPATGRKERIERALAALASMPDTIRLKADDVRWVAENPEIEDL